MFYTKQEVIKKYKNDYFLRQAVKRKEIIKLAFDLYSDSSVTDEEVVISKRYPDAIFTLHSALFLYGLTDVMPRYHFLATQQDSFNIKNIKVKQSYQSHEIFPLGKSKLKLNGGSINIYNRERLLIEIVRFKNRMPFDLYKEAINSYRDIRDELDINLINQYLSKFVHHKRYFNVIMMEVF